jgi:site-specific recombinase XerD
MWKNNVLACSTHGYYATYYFVCCKLAKTSNNSLHHTQKNKELQPIPPFRERGSGMERTITEDRIKQFQAWLRDEKVNRSTIIQYTAVIERLSNYLEGGEVTQESSENFKTWLVEEQNYKKSSANAYVFTLNTFCRAMDWSDISVKGYSLEPVNPNSGSKYVDRQDYQKLVTTAFANGEYRLAMIMQTLCHMDLRFSEFNRLTVESVQTGYVEVVRSKRTRQIEMPSYLQETLLEYIEQEGIVSGIVFCTAGGKLVDRSNVYRDIKKMCALADINSDRVQLLKFKMPRMHDYYPFYPLGTCAVAG